MLFLKEKVAIFAKENWRLCLLLFPSLQKNGANNAYCQTKALVVFYSLSKFHNSISQAKSPMILNSWIISRWQFTQHMLFSPHLSNIITIRNSVFWDAALCSSINRFQHFKRTPCLIFKDCKVPEELQHIIFGCNVVATIWRNCIAGLCYNTSMKPQSHL